MRIFAGRGQSADQVFGPISSHRGERRWNTARWVKIGQVIYSLAYAGECRAYQTVIVRGHIYRRPCVLETGRGGRHRGRHRHADGTEWLTRHGGWLR